MLNLAADDLDALLNSTLPYYMKNEMFEQANQSTPTLKLLQGKKKTFPGGEGMKLVGTASFDYTADWEIFSGEDELSFNSMNNLTLFSYEGVENHMGLKIPFTLLKAAGFMVTDKNGTDFAQASDADVLRITNILKNKYREMDFSQQQSFSKKRIWSDGSNGFSGLPGIITTTPSTGTTGSLSRATYSKWRNRALVGATDQIVPSTTSYTLCNTVEEEIMQLRRYGGMPDLIVAGSKAYKAFKIEARAQGLLTQTGFSKGATNIGIKGIAVDTLPPVVYEPALDDLGLQDHFYIVDTTAIALTMLEGDNMVVHNPSRPFNKMVAYRSVTWTGMMVATKLSSSGVYQVDDSSL